MTSVSEEDEFDDDNEYGLDDLTSPDDYTGHRMENTSVSMSMSMPPPSSIPLPHPMLTPSQLIQPQMLSHM